MEVMENGQNSNWRKEKERRVGKDRWVGWGVKEIRLITPIPETISIVTTYVRNSLKNKIKKNKKNNVKF